MIQTFLEFFSGKNKSFISQTSSSHTPQPNMTPSTISQIQSPPILFNKMPNIIVKRVGKKKVKLTFLTWTFFLRSQLPEAIEDKFEATRKRVTHTGHTKPWTQNVGRIAETMRLSKQSYLIVDTYSALNQLTRFPNRFHYRVFRGYGKKLRYSNQF